MRMTKNTATRALALASLLAGASACSGDDLGVSTETLGSLTASIEGRAYEGVTLYLPSEESATAEYASVGPMLMLSLQGHVPSSGSLTRDILNLEITLNGNSASAQVFDANVSYWPEGMSDAFYMSEEAGEQIEVSLDTLDLGDSASAKGTFRGRMCRKDSFFTEVDTDDCLTIEGRFDTALHESVF